MRVVLSLIAIVSVCTAFAVGGAAAKVGSSCKNISTFQQAAKAGEMPAIVSALHGGAPISSLLVSCSALRH
ncbi:MAG TPA: hypothetical protein VH541_08330 [Gaiellaceae bacterium]|jgi:hypothetical protein